MVYWIIGILAWNIILSIAFYRLNKEHKELFTLVLTMDDVCKSLFKSLINAVNLHTKFFNKIIDDNDLEPENKRIH